MVEKERALELIQESVEGLIRGGIIEESAPSPAPELQPTHMCTYNILADSYAQAYTGNE